MLVTMTETSSLADTKAHLSDLVARVAAHHERVTVTVHGLPTAVLMSVDDVEALEETIEILSDAATMRALQIADDEIARGEVESLDDVRAALRARRAAE